LPGDVVLFGEEPRVARLELMGADSQGEVVAQIRSLFRLATPLGQPDPEGLAALAELALAAARADSPEALATGLGPLLAKLTGAPDLPLGFFLFGTAQRAPQSLLPAELDAQVGSRGAWMVRPALRQQMMANLAQGEAIVVEQAGGPSLMIVPLCTDDRAWGFWALPAFEAATTRLSTVAGPVSALLSAALARLAQAAELKAAREENRYFRSRERRYDLFKDLIRQSQTMRTVYEQVNKLVDLPDPVWILGEKGTGKEMVARALHHLSPRAGGLMISQNCAGLPEALLDAELFGCIEPRGDPRLATPHAGLLELARGGTLFLEEIDRLPPRLQAKLARTILEREVRPEGEPIGRPVDVRILVSSERDLFPLVEQGLFRKDLYLHRAVQRVRVPPLRERVEDIIPLADVFVTQMAGRYHKQARRVADGLIPALQRHPWPGNVRELQGAIEAAVIAAPEEADEVTALPWRIAE
jgi:transcriptional regulator with GAF, ATPase, and Fis domain